MSGAIFDQQQPKSTTARLLSEAFEGCESWSTPPPRRRSASAPYDGRKDPERGLGPRRSAAPGGWIA